MRHLTYKDRIRIWVLLEEGRSQTYIADKLGFTKGTISKELKRNSNDGPYDYEVAQQKADKRGKVPRKPNKLDHPEFIDFIKNGLAQNKSPEQIARGLKTEAHKHPEWPTVHYTTIYRWITRGYL